MNEITAYTRENPFSARLNTNKKLNKEGSKKDTRHLELLLKGSGIEYSVGDSLGVWPQNDPVLVDALLKACHCNGDEIIQNQEAQISLREALFQVSDLQKITRNILPNLLSVAGNDEETKKLNAFSDPENKESFRLEYLDVLDILSEVPGSILPPQKLFDSLGKLTPRLYSIASSQKAHPDEVHLTVALETTQHKNRLRLGVCSTFMGDRVGTGGTMPSYVHKAKHFSLPEVKGTPIIMVGPGTGVAPFRAFLEERRAIGDPGKNWLFFGDQKRQYDFLYEDEFTVMQKDGFLTELDLAFSRDQEEKVYVQHKMKEKASEFWKWLEEGAYFYVCGDAKRMAKDVENMLFEVIADGGEKSEDEAKEYVKQMKKDKRYLKDVY